MKMMYCERCGGDEFREENGYRVCRFCKTKYQLQREEMLVPESSISVNDDIQRLLNLCKENPANASKYAGLILDIDPTNREVMQYLRRR